MANELGIDKTLSKLLPQCYKSAWQTYMTQVNGGVNPYEKLYQQALKAHTYEKLDDDSKQYLADCQKSNRIAEEKGINLRKTVDKDVMNKQIREICDEVSIRKPDARTEDEKNIVFDRGQEE
jgi:hypothetical protein